MTIESKTTKGATLVRAALEARNADDADNVNDMIESLTGGRHERFAGDNVNNLGPLSTSGSYDHKALEPLTNMHDAILERFAHEQYGNDLVSVPFETPREAAVGLLGHLTVEEKSELARVDIYDSDPPAKQSKRVTLTYRDKGCGIRADYVGDSIFRIGSAHKEANSWQQGAFGMGATTCYPNAEAVVLVSRRPPGLLEESDEDQVTVAVAQWQQHRKGRGIYYLVTEEVDQNPQASPFSVPAAEVPEFEPGTYLALISYATDGFHTGRNDRSSLEFVINTRLWSPPLPVSSMNHVAKGDHVKNHQGRGPQFDSTERPDRKHFTDVIPFRIGEGTHHLPVDIYYFEGGPSGDRGSMRNFVAQGHSVLLLANGQTHKHWDQQELRLRANRLPKLYDRILVVVDLDQIPVDVRTSKLFTPDRVDMVKTPDTARLQDTIAAMLNSSQDLRDLNNELVREALKNRSADRSTLQIADKIRAQLAFKGGVSLSRGTKEGDDAPPRRKWGKADLWPDPTILEGPTSIRAIPGKTRFIHFQINATDDFLHSGRGTLDLTCDHPRIGPAELVAGGELRGGMVRASLLVPEDVEIGATATITAAVRDWSRAAGGIGGDLGWKVQLEVVANGKSPTKRNPKKRKKDSASRGGEVAVIWRDSSHTDWNGSVPGAVELVEASVLAEENDEYVGLGKFGTRQIPCVVLNEQYAPLKRYEAERAKKFKTSTLDEARDRYAVGVGVGLLVLEDQSIENDKAGKMRSENDLVERQAVSRAALALMPDFDKLVQEAGLAE